MTAMTLSEFESQALAQGYGAVVVRQWEPGTVLDSHTHPFDASALVVAGDMWLTVGTVTRHLGPGDRFEVAHGVVHAERYGPQGATYWVARREAGSRG